MTLDCLGFREHRLRARGARPDMALWLRTTSMQHVFMHTGVLALGLEWLAVAKVASLG